MVELSSTRVSSSMHPCLDEIWSWLGEVPDPEIPVVSVVDLGIVRAVRWSEEDANLCVVTVTPTYSGCPATEVIARDIREALLAHGVPRVLLQVQLSPAWTTDWLSERARRNLHEYGIAPPVGSAARQSGNGMAAGLVMPGDAIESRVLKCPRCGSANTETISPFGSTPCKSLHRCTDCLEPFDHFKCH